MTSAADHPRDQHIQFQDKLRHNREGDVVDAKDDKKVTVDISLLEDNTGASSSSSQSAATFTFLHEDHTLGNPLRSMLMKDQRVISAGYAIPHPLEPKMVLHVQTEGYCVPIVSEQLMNLASICDSLRKQVPDASTLEE